MNIQITKNDQELGKKAAVYVADRLKQIIAEKGEARLLLSTGASQLTTINELVKQPVDWGKVEMFHLDEYVNLSETHNASFRKYLKERFTSKVHLKEAHFVGEGNVEENIRKLTDEVRKAPIDIALIGIGENAHIAFNDPPANFETRDAYILVELDNACKNQQVGEGWFNSIEEVPDRAITMTVHQILQSKEIISCVPYKVKAESVKKTLEQDVNNMVPATILKTHANWTLYLDEESASLIQ
ncbi:glucosamine-6-phosphate deaminase [Virgibacillus sp. W0430]|uniref:glucosamine-6-phosphate deaminase n=1 Tax=Virgibacillus sp. W0430 TaxID=3391580 RepID=UPI003F4627C4